MYNPSIRPFFSLTTSPSPRRARYDRTGSTTIFTSLSTADNNDDDDDDIADFDWTSFYRAQYADVVSAASIASFAKEYRHSDDERRDVLAAYTKHAGDIDMLFEEVMLSDVREDEERFRNWIQEAIDAGEVEPYEKFLRETMEEKGKGKAGGRGRKRRVERAKREAEEAEELARELGVRDKLMGGGGQGEGEGEGEGALAALIQQRQRGRMEGFLEDLERKYAKPTTKTSSQNKKKSTDGSGKGKGERKKGKPATADEPPEEAFQRTEERARNKRKRRSE